MIETVRFYNHGGLGDLHVSRTFVKEIIKERPDLRFFYHHKHDPSILSDIKIPTDKLHIGLEKTIKHEIKFYSNFYMNTWYGYDTPTTLKTLYDNFKPLYRSLNLNQKELIYYLPDIDYDKFAIGSIDKFKFDKKVLICNNRVISGQSDGFNMDNLIKLLARKNKSTLFVVTNSDVVYNYKKIKMNNVIYFDDILPKENNLNEIAYLSTTCNAIIGKNSGPHTFCFNKTNLLRKTNFISFCYGWWPFYDFGLARVCENVNFTNILPTFNINDMEVIICEKI